MIGGATLFMLAWIVGVASWFLAVAEGIGVWRFSPWAYRLGLRVLSDERVVPSPAGRLAVGELLQTATGGFKRVAQDRCLFRSRLRRFAVRTPFPVKGSVRWRGEVASIEGRIPLFTTAFLLAWLAGWTAGSAMALTSPHAEARIGILFLLVGWAGALGMVGLSLPLELRRARALVDELESQLRAPPC